MAQLGGPIIPSQCSALQLVLNNFDGYYTFGAGMALGPGSKVRLRWRAATGTPWVTRFVGSLSVLTTGTDANPIMITRWVGALYRFTSGNIPGRLIINQTPQSIMTVLSDAAGIPAADRDFDTLDTLYNRQLSPGYAGVQEVQTMVDGFIYDGPDKVAAGTARHPHGQSGGCPIHRRRPNGCRAGSTSATSIDPAFRHHQPRGRRVPVLHSDEYIRHHYPPHHPDHSLRGGFRTSHTNHRVDVAYRPQSFGGSC